MATLVMFSVARQASGVSKDHFPVSSLEDLLHQACDRYGAAFGEVLACSRVWVNGEAPGSAGATPLSDRDEVAILPAVAGG
ncbi:MoaD/ThiS family protein [Rhodococcus koreensis]|uniref:MoaD/ThiS family protein n=1 Tax=Rhodococcus koreensis TaxID=99653 RepID=UPI00366F50B8